MDKLFQLAKENTITSYDRHPEINTVNIHIQQIVDLILHDVEKIIMDSSMIGKDSAYIGIYHKKFITDNKLKFYNFIYMPEHLEEICKEHNIKSVVERIEKKVEPFELRIDEIKDYILFSLHWGI